MNATEWLETLASWIWQTSWQASVLVGLVWLARWLIGQELEPRWRNGLWWFVVVRSLPFTGIIEVSEKAIETFREQTR